MSGVIRIPGRIAATLAIVEPMSASGRLIAAPVIAENGQAEEAEQQ